MGSDAISGRRWNDLEIFGPAEHVMTAGARR
jgi:hypothetical protein